MESVAVRMSMHSNHSQDHTCVSDRVQNIEFRTILHIEERANNYMNYPSDNFLT